MKIKRDNIIDKSPVFYGWIILFAASFGIVMTMPGQTSGISVFVDFIIEDLELSRTRVSLMYLIANITASFILPWVGRLIDRHGPRYMVILITIVFSVACFWMGFVQNIVMLLFGFVLLRAMGTGSLTLVSYHTVNLWFVRRRGMAVGIAGIGSAIGVAFFPAFINLLISNFGWRMAYILLGLILLALMLPIGAIFFRGHPESYGQLPDGKNSEEVNSETNISAKRALRSGIFWLFASANITMAAIGTGLLFHHFDIMATSNISRADAAQAFIMMGLFIAIANFATGLLMDKFSPKLVLFFEMSLLAFSLYVASNIGLFGLFFYGALVGVNQGISGTLHSGVHAHYFGRQELGEIKGIVSTLAVIGSALGPAIFAYGKDFNGSYQTTLLSLVLIPIVIVLFVPFTKPRFNIVNK